MPISRREALRELSALFAIPLLRCPDRVATDPLVGTIAEYQAGRARGEWTALEATKTALDRCSAWSAALNAVDEI